MLRELKFTDAALKNPETLRWNSVLKRYGGSTKTEEDDDAELLEGGKEPDGPTDSSQQTARPRLPTKENPVGVAVYGQICLAARSYQSALCEWSVWYCLIISTKRTASSLSTLCV